MGKKMDKTPKIPALLLNSSMSRAFEQVHCHFIRFIQPSINSSILQNSWCPMTQKRDSEHPSRTRNLLKQIFIVMFTLIPCCHLHRRSRNHLFSSISFYWTLASFTLHEHLTLFSRGGSISIINISF